MKIPDVMLNNGRTIPQFGFGVFRVPPAETAEAVSTALQDGYRHIDTAQMYGNEREVGEAIARSGLDRSEVSVTPGRIRENIDIFDFELSGEDVEAISALNRNQRTGPDPDHFDYIPG